MLVYMCMVDLIKQRWDLKRLGLTIGVQELQTERYLERLNKEFLSKENLAEVIYDSDELFKDYKEKLLKYDSVEEFLQSMNMINTILEQHESIENYVLSHF